MAKVICSEAICRVVDRSMQILGALGTTRDTMVARIYRDVRSFRIYDGPSEVHRWNLGRQIEREEVGSQHHNAGGTSIVVSTDFASVLGEDFNANVPPPFDGKPRENVGFRFFSLYHAP